MPAAAGRCGRRPRMGGARDAGNGTGGGDAAGSHRRAPRPGLLGRRPRRARRLPEAFSERAPPRRGAVQEGGGHRTHGAGWLARRAARSCRRDRHLPSGVGGGAARGLGGSGRRTPGANCRQPARRRGRCPPDPHGRRAGHARHRALRLQPQRRIGGHLCLRARRTRPGRRPRMPRPLLSRPVRVEGPPAPARGPAVRRGRGGVWTQWKPRPARQVALPGSPLLREHRESPGCPGPLRPGGGRARRPQLCRRRPHSVGRAGIGRGRRGHGGQDSGRGADPLSQGRPSQ